MSSAVVYIHGKGGSAKESKHYASLFPGRTVIGYDYKAETPWEAKEEFPAFFEEIERRYSSVILVANSIGAYFSMVALAGRKLEKAFFISPITDMEKLIKDMMAWAGVTEEDLRAKGEIKTAFGETLSWKYLSYAREHPVAWKIPTSILYGGRDHLVSRETIEDFASHIGAKVTVMEEGEHWFHTDPQLAFLDEWIAGKLKIRR